jgi:hypothetical protein
LTYITAIAQRAAALTLLEALAAAWDNVIDAQVESVKINYDVTAEVSGLKSSPGDQSVAEGATVRLTKIGGKLHPYWIPSAKAGVFLSDFATIDTSDSELVTLFGLFDPDNGEFVSVSDNEFLTGPVPVYDGWYAARQRTARR